jgi:hypothetical protein
MNVELMNQIYEDLASYLVTKSKYGPRVVAKSLKQSDKFPLVVITEGNNANTLVSTDFGEKTDTINISVNIYAQDKAIGNETVADVVIARELMKLVDDIVGTKYRMLRTDCRPTPNLDNSIYRVTMNYTKRIITKRNILI